MSDYEEYRRKMRVLKEAAGIISEEFVPEEMEVDAATAIKVLGDRAEYWAICARGAKPADTDR